jgi:hypothetical protein
MIVKLSILGLFIVLIVVLTITYYTQLEGFIATKTAAGVLATSGNLNFKCQSNADIRNGVGNDTIYTASSDGNGGSVISVSNSGNATVMVSNCGCLTLGPNMPEDVMMCTNAASGKDSEIPVSRDTIQNPKDINIDDSLKKVYTPSVVNPDVSLSDTGYQAMALHKHSNLLNDIQKIVHNELLANRMMDSSVKNAPDRSMDNGSMGNGSMGDGSMGNGSMGNGSMGNGSMGNGSMGDGSMDNGSMGNGSMGNGSMGNGSMGDGSMDNGSMDNGSMGNGTMGGSSMRNRCNSDSSMRNRCNSDSSDSSDSCEQEERHYDMSKYIKKDEIPCWGCSVDY